MHLMYTVIYTTLLSNSTHEKITLEGIGECDRMMLKYTGTFSTVCIMQRLSKTTHPLNNLISIILAVFQFNNEPLLKPAEVS